MPCFIDAFSLYLHHKNRRIGDAVKVHLKIGLFAQNECSNESTALCRPEIPMIDNDEKVTSNTLAQVTMKLIIN